MHSARQFLKPVSTETRNGRHHGRFEEWLEAHCETLGMRMARYYYMQMALRCETLGIPQKKAIEGLKSFRQIRDALLDKLTRHLPSGRTRSPTRLQSGRDAFYSAHPCPPSRRVLMPDQVQQILQVL